MTAEHPPANTTDQGRPLPPTAWKPGQSGNPSGRPRVVGHVRDLARKQTAKAIRTLTAIMDDSSARDTARVTAATALLDRAWGRPAQAIALGGPEGGPVRLDLTKLTDTELAALKELIRHASPDAG